jgi:AcrR family transcriptional regulator
MTAKKKTRTIILEAALKALREEPIKVNITRIAHIAKCSRQTIYLHFANSTELQIEAALYIDEQYNLDDLVAKLLKAQTPKQLLEDYVEFCLIYCSELYPVIRAADSVRRSDYAVDAAWKNRLSWRRRIGYQISKRLAAWDVLAPHWTTRNAGDWLTVQGSFHIWEDLVLDLGYSSSRYVSVMNSVLSHALLRY